MTNKADVGKRVAAFLLDMTVFGVAYYGGIYLLLNLTSLSIGYSYANLLLTFGPVIVYIFYFLILEAIYSSTPGKRILSIRVVDSESEASISVMQSIVRNTLRWIEVFPGFLIGILLIITTDRNQRLGDFLAQTEVIEVN